MILLDSTTLVALGGLHELDVLAAFDGRLAVPPAIREEITEEPEQSNVADLLTEDAVALDPPEPDSTDRARRTLGETEVNGDVHVVAYVYQYGGDVGVVSDDHAVRTTASALGAVVTGKLGTVVRAVTEGQRTESDARRLVRQLDENGLHTTASLRERVFEAIEDAVEE